MLGYVFMGRAFMRECDVLLLVFYCFFFYLFLCIFAFFYCFFSAALCSNKDVYQIYCYDDHYDVLVGLLRINANDD